MSTNYVERIFVEVDGQDVADVKSVDRNTVRDTKVVKTMSRRNRGRGFSGGVPHWELNIKVAVPVAGGFDWAKAFRDDVDLTLVAEEAGVTRYRYSPCRITDVGTTCEAEGGEAERTIKLLALDEQEE